MKIAIRILTNIHKVEGGGRSSIPTKSVRIDSILRSQVITFGPSTITALGVVKLPKRVLWKIKASQTFRRFCPANEYTLAISKLRLRETDAFYVNSPRQNATSFWPPR